MSVAGLIVSLSIIFDAVTDPLVAFLEDKTSGRFGRYRPYLIIGSPISAVATVMLFFKIPAEGNAAAVYYLCVYRLYKLGYTMTSMARHGLTATLSSDRATRNTIVTVGKLFATPVGLLLSFAHQIVKQAGEGNEAQGWLVHDDRSVRRYHGGDDVDLVSCRAALRQRRDIRDYVQKRKG